MASDLGQVLGTLKQNTEGTIAPQLGKGGDPITWIEFYNQDVQVENCNIFIGSCTPNGSWLIWDHPGSPLYGLWDVGSWADSSGTGSPYFNCQRFLELKLHQFFTEEFNNTTYKDTGSTTGTWTTTGSASLISDNVIQSLKVLGSDIQLGSFNRVTMSIVGSNTQYLRGEISLDGGTNFTEVTFGVEETITSNLGSDVRFRITNTSSEVAGGGYDGGAYDSSLYDGVISCIIQSVDLELKSPDY